MVGLLCNIFFILGYISIMCGIIRTRKIIMFLLSSKKRHRIHFEYFKHLYGRRIYLYILNIAYILLILFFIIRIMELILNLDKYLFVGHHFLWYTRNILFVISFLVFLRLIFLRLKVELKITNKTYNG